LIFVYGVWEFGEFREFDWNFSRAAPGHPVPVDKSVDNVDNWEFGEFGEFNEEDLQI